MMVKTTYDLIFSLGGSCAWASQLRRRELRLASLPFDWLFVADDEPLRRLNVCFQEDFAHWMEQKNLKPLEGAERSPTGSALQYKDIATGYRSIHDFTKPVEDTAAYKLVADQYRRRIERLYDYLKRSKTVCMCYDAGWRTDYTALANLRQTILEKFGAEKRIDIVLNEFGSDEEKVIQQDGMTISRWIHPKNDYIFSQKSFEYAFLDNVSLSGCCPQPAGHSKWFQIGRLPHGGFKCYFLPKAKPTLRTRLSFGTWTKLDLGIGKPGK